MSNLDDYRFDSVQQPPFQPEDRRSSWRLPVIVGVLLTLSAAAYFLFVWRRPQAPPADVRVHTEQAVAPATDPKPVAEPGEDIPLPPLAESDALVRELVRTLTSHPKVAEWLATDQLIRNFTVVTYNIANGRTPAKYLPTLQPAEKFSVRDERGSITLDPRSYRRYDAYANALTAVDARGAARLYATLRPRIQDAYRELGIPDGNFDPVLERAIQEILKTPIVDGNVTLSSKSVAYEFADPRLQSLSPIGRQMLRMGPRNVRLVQDKLREIAPLLGFSLQSPAR